MNKNFSEKDNLGNYEHWLSHEIYPLVLSRNVELAFDHVGLVAVTNG